MSLIEQGRLCQTLLSVHKFGAGVFVGVGSVGLLVSIGGGMERQWLFIALSAVVTVTGIGAYCLLRFDKDSCEAKARRVLGLD